jgi:hypothetical protein
MDSTPTETSATPETNVVRLPWETVDDDDAVRDDAACDDAARDDDASGESAEFVVVDDSDDRDAEDGAAAPGDDAIEYEYPLPAEPLIDELGPAPAGGGWTLVSLCAGVAILACCVLIPQADANRRLAYDREKLKADLESIRKQVATNDDFLRRVADDPNLAERLAQRQMKIIRQGTRVLELKGNARRESRAGAGAGVPLAASAGLSPDEMSPFQLVHVAPPPPMAPYQPVGGVLAGLTYNPRSRLYLIGTGLFLMALGLVFGFGAKE